MKEIRTLPQVRRVYPAHALGILWMGIFAVLGFTANFRMEAIDWALLVLVAGLTIGGTIALSQAIRKNPGAFGEARFDTSHPDDPAG